MHIFFWSMSALPPSGVCLLYCRSPGQQLTIQLFCFFSATPRHLDYVRPCQCFETGDTETSVLGSSLINWNIGHMLQLFPSSGRSQELGFSFHSFCTELEVETMASMCCSSNHCLCFRQHPTWYSYSSVLRFRQERNQSL